jgi:predicted acyltransferase
MSAAEPKTAAGFALTPLSPMIKRICTYSFVIASGGFCLLTLAFCYWFIDSGRGPGLARTGGPLPPYSPVDISHGRVASRRLVP